MARTQVDKALDAMEQWREQDSEECYRHRLKRDRVRRWRQWAVRIEELDPDA